jgi:hypothetical protein
MRPGPVLLPLLVLLAAPAAAQQPVLATYEVYAAGMTVMEMQARFQATEAGYRMETRFRTRGIVSLFAAGEQTTQVEGEWAGTAAHPRRYLTEGTWRGSFRRVTITWQGRNPSVGELTPSEAGEREEVPEALRRDTVDALSALAQLARMVDRTGGCDGATGVFDGRRRSDYTSRSEGRELIRPWRGAWSGEALRCAFEGRVVAGFRHDQNRAVVGAPQTSTTWIASPYPGAPPIPVRLEIPNRWVGHATAVLLRAEPSAPVAQPVQQRR